MRVLAIRALRRAGHYISPGTAFEVPDDEAARLIADGRAVAVKVPEVQGPEVATAPEVETAKAPKAETATPPAAEAPAAPQTSERPTRGVARVPVTGRHFRPDEDI